MRNGNNDAFGEQGFALLSVLRVTRKGIGYQSYRQFYIAHGGRAMTSRPLRKTLKQRKAINSKRLLVIVTRVKRKHFGTVLEDE